MNDYKSIKDIIISTEPIVKDWYSNEIAKQIIKGMIQGDDVVGNLNLVNVRNRFVEQNLMKIWRNAKWIRQTITTYQFQDYKTETSLRDKFTKLWNEFKGLMINNANMDIPDLNKKSLMFNEYEAVVNSNIDNDVSFLSTDTVNASNINGLDLKNYIKKKSADEPFYKQTLKTVFGFEGFVDDKCWSTKDKGAILFSDNENNYFKISNEGSFIKADTTDEAKQIIDIINSIGNDPL